MIERHPITDRASWLAMRRADVTASTIGCLLGIHEYMTAYELFALKTGLIDEDPEESRPMRRGRLLEDVAVDLIREEHPTWNVAPAAAYYRDPEARLGASPDVLAIDPDRGLGVIQVKCPEPSVFRRKWRDDDGQVQPPLWIALQAITEAHLVGAEWAAVAAMTVGFGIDLHIVPVPIHAGVIDRIRAEVATFWRRVADNEPPPPDFARDGEIITRLYPADDGEIIDLTGDNRIVDLLDDMEARKADEKAAGDDLKEIKAEILSKLGPAAGARTRRGLLTAKTIHRKEFTVPASSYRRIALKPDNNREAKP